MARSNALVHRRPMDREWWLAVAILALAIAAHLAAAGLIVAAPVDSGTASIGVGEGVAFGLAWATFSVVGTIIIRRRPGNPIGWLCVFAGLQAGLLAIVTAAATASLAGDPRSSTGIAFAWLSHTFVNTVVIVPVLIMLRFPTGLSLGPAWRQAERLAVLVIAGLAGLFAIEPMPLFSFPGTPNPLGLGSPRLTAIVPGFIVLWFIPVGSGVAALLVRYRRGSVVERRQIRWLAAASCIVGLAVVSMPLTSPEISAGRMSTASAIAFAIGFWTIPVAIGIAIVRHQLYDIDRIVKRTLVYALVSGVLGLTYAVTVLGLSAPLTALLPTAGSTLTTVASTLLVAALFRPVRSRAQGAVDRRFDRERHEATGIVDAFAGRMRAQVELDGIVGDLLLAAARTVHPMSSSCWLRTRGSAERPQVESADGP